jgi:hypothetical protein
LTGILEGEGTFLHGPPSAPNTPIVRVEMTDRDVVERVGALLGRAVVPIAPREAHYKPSFIVSIKGLDAVRLMVSAKPSLSSARREQIEGALRDWGLGRVRWSYVGLSCAADGCGAPARTKGLCDVHFNRWYNATQRGAPTPFEPRPITRDAILREPPPHPLTPDSCDLPWLAGLLEGEGTFSRTRTKGGRSYPVLSVNMCSREIVERVALLFGGINVQVRKPRDPAWSITHVAAINGAAAATWMQRLRPLMGERRRGAIDLALDDYYPERLITAPDHCVVPGCFGKPRGRGLCHRHYMSWSRDRAKGRTPRVKPLRSN